MGAPSSAVPQRLEGAAGSSQAQPAGLAPTMFAEPRSAGGGSSRAPGPGCRWWHPRGCAATSSPSRGRASRGWRCSGRQVWPGGAGVMLGSRVAPRRGRTPHLRRLRCPSHAEPGLASPVGARLDPRGQGRHTAGAQPAHPRGCRIDQLNGELMAGAPLRRGSGSAAAIEEVEPGSPGHCPRGRCKSHSCSSSRGCRAPGRV